MHSTLLLSADFQSHVGHCHTEPNASPPLTADGATMMEVDHETGQVSLVSFCVTRRGRVNGQVRIQKEFIVSATV